MTERAITRICEDAIAAQIFPGVVVLVSQGGQHLQHLACGTTMYADSGSRPVALNDIFDIASLTKIVTATAALVLLDAGWLKLEEEVTHWLPAVRAHGVTLYHLLTHSSGLDLRLSLLREAGAAGIRDAVWAAQPLCQPGSVVAYTNINSFLLGEVVACVAGAPLDLALRELVLGPLGMEETSFCPPASLTARIVPTEWDNTWRGGLVHGTVHDESAAALGGIAGHAGLFSTTSDLERLMRMWLEGGSRQGRQILHEASVAEALRNHTSGLRGPGGSTIHCGLGWMLNRPGFMGSAAANSFGHTGFTGPALVGLPEHNLALVVLSNRTYPQRTPPPYRHHAITAELVNRASTHQ